MIGADSRRTFSNTLCRHVTRRRNIDDGTKARDTILHAIVPSCHIYRHTYRHLRRLSRHYVFEQWDSRKTGERKPETTKLRSLHERIEKDSKTLLGMSFTIVNLRMIELDPGSFKYQYYVQYTSGEKAGTYQFCVLTVFQDDEGQTLPLQMWGPFAKVIGMTAEAFVNLEEDQQKVAIESIENEARYNIEVKFTNDGFKLTNLELAQEKIMTRAIQCPLPQRRPRRQPQERPEDIQVR